MTGSAGGISFLAHYAGGTFTQAAVDPATITIESVSRIPTAQQLAGGYTYPPGNRGEQEAAVLLQYN